MLAKLQRLWLIEATKYNVLPMDDRTAERLEPTQAGRPTLIRGTSLFFPGMWDASRRTAWSASRTSRSPSPPRSRSAEGAQGVIIAQGGRFGGWALYAKDGRAKFVYNVLGIQEFATEAEEPIPGGTHQVQMEFAYDGGLARGGNVTLYYGGKAVGTGRVSATQPMIFSADETTDIGSESGTTVTPDYRPRQPVHRQDQLGADRSEHRRQRPLHRPRGAATYRHGPSVGNMTSHFGRRCGCG